MVNPENYVMLLGWMRTELDLKGNELNLYALIYGFTQDGETEFSGSIRYMQDWLGAESKQTVFNTLDKLISKGFIQKRTEVVNGVKRNHYLATPRGSLNFRPPQSKFCTRVVQKLDHPSPNFRPNNIEDNIEDNLVINSCCGDPRLDTSLGLIIQTFEENLGSFPPAARESLIQWREIFTDDMILLAIKKAAMANVRKWTYVNGILKGWKAEGVRTLGDAQESDNRRKPATGQQPKRSAAEDYDEIFKDLLRDST